MPPTNRYSTEVVAAQRAAAAAVRAELTSTASALGFADVAGDVATALTTYLNAPNYGLDGYDDRLRAARIRAGVDAVLVTQSRREAA